MLPASRSIIHARRSGTMAGCSLSARTGARCSGTWPAARSSPSCRSATPVHLMFEPSGDLITSGSIGVQRWPIQLDAGRGEFRIGPPRRLPLPASYCGIAEDRSGRIVAKANCDYAYVATPERTIRVGPLDDCRSRRRQSGRAMAGDRHARGESRCPGLAHLRPHARWPICPSMDGTAVAFSPDGKWLMTGIPGCRLWEVGTWREERQISGR